jgi:UDP-N-acetylmuramate dehydrogenase
MSLPLPQTYQARVLRDEPMAKHTSWHVGGPADGYFTPRDRDDLSDFLRELPGDVPVYWVGLGSNLLVRDGGLRGVVIATLGVFKRIERRAELRVYCESGVPCTTLARQSVRWGMSQGEFFAGIPGTLGGALAMNAGAYQGETWKTRAQCRRDQSSRRAADARRHRVPGRLSPPAATGQRRVVSRRGAAVCSG